MTKLNLTPAEAAKEIKAVKQCNKVARETRAVKRGFKTSAEYLTALTNVVNGTVAPEKKVTSGKATKKKVASKAGIKPVIFVIDVLDRSGSMGSLRSTDSRIAHAVAGINSSVTKLKEEESELGVEYKHIFTHFDTEIVISEARPIDKVPHLSVDGRGGTALNDTIIQVIDRALSLKSKEDKVLVNIYTDGDENASRATHDQAKRRINASEKDGIVVTFVGTKLDTDRAIRDYGIYESNTMVYDGSAQGMFMSMQETSSARSKFSKKVAAGEDVKTGFYKKIVK